MIVIVRWALNVEQTSSLRLCRVVRVVRFNRYLSGVRRMKRIEFAEHEH